MDVAERMTYLNEVEHSQPPRHALHDAPWDVAGDAARDALALVQETLDHSRADTAHPAALVAALNVLRQLRAQLTGWEPELIAAARAQKVSWAALAPALGVTSRQAAERRYLRLRPSDNGERTGEERVRGHRDRRAGDRAVVAWARDNAGLLRQLAGQVSALHGLPPGAQDRVDRVGQALHDNDPAHLVSPLADIHPDLTTRYAGLAAQVRAVTDQATAIRRSTEVTRSGGPSVAPPRRDTLA